MQSPCSWQRADPRTELVLQLLKLGAKANVHNSLGESPLSNALGGADIALAAELLKRGADVNARDGRGYTALIAAVKAGYRFKSKKSPVVPFLLDAGIDVNLPDHSGKTALIYAVEEGDVELIEALIKRGADRTAKDMSGVSALAVAESKNQSRFSAEHNRRVLALLTNHGSRP